MQSYTIKKNRQESKKSLCIIFIYLHATCIKATLFELVNKETFCKIMILCVILKIPRKNRLKKNALALEDIKK